MHSRERLPSAVFAINPIGRPSHVKERCHTRETSNHASMGMVDAAEIECTDSDRRNDSDFE
jgi:hypothetical protein